MLKVYVQNYYEPVQQCTIFEQIQYLNENHSLFND